MKNFHSKDFMHVKNVTLMVQDIERSLTFYQQALGLKLITQKDSVYVLGTNNNHKLITLIHNPLAAPKIRTTGLYHYAVLLPSRAHLGQIIKHFIKHQIPVTGGADHGISEALYLDDPDGNGIELYADKDTSEWPSFDDIVNAPMNYQDLIKNALNEPFERIPDQTIMGHIHLHVSNIGDAIKFFVETLGFKSTMTYGPHAHFVSDKNYHHHIGFNVWNGTNIPNNPPNTVGLKSYELYVPHAMYADLMERLEKHAVKVHKENDTIFIYDVNHVKLFIQTQ